MRWTHSFLLSHVLLTGMYNVQLYIHIDLYVLISRCIIFHFMQHNICTYKGLDTIKASNYIFSFPDIYICITIFWELWAYLLICSSLSYIITKFHKWLLETKVDNTFPKLWIQIFFFKESQRGKNRRNISQNCNFIEIGT